MPTLFIALLFAILIAVFALHRIPWLSASIFSSGTTIRRWC